MAGLKSLRIFKDIMARKKDTQTSVRMERSKVRAALEAMLEDNLTDYDAVFTFQVEKSLLDDILELMEDPELLQKYEFSQQDIEGDDIPPEKKKHGQTFQVMLRSLDDIM